MSSVLLTFENNVWKEVQKFTNVDGLTTSKVFSLQPIANGLLKVECEDGSFSRNCDIRLEERGENLLILTAVSHDKGI